MAMTAARTENYLRDCGQGLTTKMLKKLIIYIYYG